MPWAPIMHGGMRYALALLLFSLQEIYGESHHTPLGLLCHTFHVTSSGPFISNSLVNISLPLSCSINSHRACLICQIESIELILVGFSHYLVNVCPCLSLQTKRRKSLDKRMVGQKRKNTSQMTIWHPFFLLVSQTSCLLKGFALHLGMKAIVSPISVEWATKITVRLARQEFNSATALFPP